MSVNFYVYMNQVAILETGGKQYLVHPGDVISVEKIPDTTKEIPDLLTGKTISIEIMEQKRFKKIRVLKFRAKSRYKRVAGHRQAATTIKIGKW